MIVFMTKPQMTIHRLNSYPCQVHHKYISTQIDYELYKIPESEFQDVVSHSKFTQTGSAMLVLSVVSNFHGLQFHVINHKF